MDDVEPLESQGEPGRDAAAEAVGEADPDATSVDVLEDGFGKTMDPTGR